MFKLEKRLTYRGYAGHDLRHILGAVVAIVVFATELGCAGRQKVTTKAVAVAKAKVNPVKIRKKPTPKEVRKKPLQKVVEAPKKTELPICRDDEKEASSTFNPDRIKLAIVNPNATTCNVELKTLEIPRKPCRKVKTKSALELAKPVFDLFKGLKAEVKLELEVTNKKAFLNARSASEIPNEFLVKVREKWSVRGLKDKVAIEVAKRAIEALDNREKESGKKSKEKRGTICVDTSLFKHLGKKGKTRSRFSLDMKTIATLTKGLKEQGRKPRYAAVTLEMDNGLASSVERFEITSPLRIIRDNFVWSSLLAGASNSEQCLWVLMLQHYRADRDTHKFAIPVPRDKNLVATRFLRVRAAREGKGVVGKPKVMTGRAFALSKALELIRNVEGVSE